MNYKDERTTYQFNKRGFIKAVIFLAIIILIIIHRIISRMDIISIIILLAVPIVSITLLVKGIKRKKITLSEVIDGMAAGDERIVNVIDAAGMKAVGYGTSILLLYCVYGFIRFSSQKVILELLLFLLVCFDTAIEERLINKNYIACTDKGFEQPYYDDKKKEKGIVKRIILSWTKFAMFFSGIDVITSLSILKHSPASLLLKYIMVLPGEIILCLILAAADILIMEYINHRVYKQIK